MEDSVFWTILTSGLPLVLLNA